MFLFQNASFHPCPHIDYPSRLDLYSPDVPKAIRNRLIIIHTRSTHPGRISIVRTMWRRSQTAAALAATTTQRSCRSWWSSQPHQELQVFYRCLSSSSSSSSSAGTGDGTSGAGGPAGGRKRHRFFNNINAEDVVPSFRDFQLRFQLRSLYRKYWRLASTKNAEDLRRQIRAEFRSNNNKTTTPNGSAMILDERAISEGNRRYKELQNVLSAAGTTTTTGGTPTSGAAAQNDWPWNKQRNTKPEVFPPKSTTPSSSMTKTGQ
jgi:Complex 1 protein (LYR family)